MVQPSRSLKGADRTCDSFAEASLCCSFIGPHIVRGINLGSSDECESYSSEGVQRYSAGSVGTAEKPYPDGK